MRCLIPLALVVSAVAFGQEAKSSFLPGITFSKFHTYQWVTKRPHPNPSVDAAIRRSIESQLNAKGLSRASDKADLTVDYRVAMSEGEQWSSFGQMDFETQSPHTVTVQFGTLGIDFADPALNRIVWTGLVAKVVDPTNSQETKQENLDKAVQKLLKNFPPK
jgi:Domain of unknown function (DUF4136)